MTILIHISGGCLQAVYGPPESDLRAIVIDSDDLESHGLTQESQNSHLKTMTLGMVEIPILGKEEV